MQFIQEVFNYGLIFKEKAANSNELAAYLKRNCEQLIYLIINFLTSLILFSV